MPSKSNWSRVLLLVDSNQNLRPFRKFLLSPESVQKVIKMTNSGHLQNARNFVIQAEWLLRQIQNLDQEIDLAWDFNIVTELRKALEQAETPEQK